KKTKLTGSTGQSTQRKPPHSERTCPREKERDTDKEERLDGETQETILNHRATQAPRPLPPYRRCSGGHAPFAGRLWRSGGRVIRWPVENRSFVSNRY